jgi:hypothetical protein
MTTYRPEQAQDYLQCLVALYSARARHAWLANPPPPPSASGGVVLATRRLLLLLKVIYRTPYVPLWFSLFWRDNCSVYPTAPVRTLSHSSRPLRCLLMNVCQCSLVAWILNLLGSFLEHLGNGAMRLAPRIHTYAT